MDNLNVVRHVGRIVAGETPDRPSELLVDGDFLMPKMSLGTYAISNVKSHADEDMVRRGGVRPIDKIGNDRADEAADFCRRGVRAAATHQRRALDQSCGHWYTIVYDVHRLFIAIARAVVNDDRLGWYCS